MRVAEMMSYAKAQRQRKLIFQINGKKLNSEAEEGPK